MNDHKIVCAWKTNKKVFQYVSKEMQKWAIGHKKHMLCGQMSDCDFIPMGGDDFERGRIYRLPPDFVFKKPVYEYFKIEPVYNEDMNMTEYTFGRNGRYFSVKRAESLVGFEGYTLEAKNTATVHSIFDPLCKYIKIRTQMSI